MKYTPAGSWSTRVRRGLHTQVENYLNRYDNPEADPDVQIFDNEEDEEPETKYFCAVCKMRIRYYHDLQEWFCNNCGQHYDTKIQDRPVTNTRNFKVVPHYQIHRYPKLDDQDPNIPYMKGIQLDEEGIGEVEEVQLIKSSPDQRVQHLRVKGSMADAMKWDYEFTR